MHADEVPMSGIQADFKYLFASSMSLHDVYIIKGSLCEPSKET
jgi:hypothetical protein